MTYDAVKRILVDEDPELIRAYQPLVDRFPADGRSGQNPSSAAA